MSKNGGRWCAAALLATASMLGEVGVLPARDVAGAAAGAVYLQWMRAAPLRPSTIWIGGTRDCANPEDSDTPCPSWAMGSTNGGRTWHDATEALTRAAQDTGAGCTYARNPAVLDRPSRQIAIE
ncbi:MAG TPA: hypothetical protein VHB98_20940, partial [Chloroflexota bacterium]|nr:hypothetical protein [Chloroflexota bacterium]